MNDSIEILEEFIKYFEAEAISRKYRRNISITVGEDDIQAIENLIKGYRNSEDIMKNSVKENLELKEYIRELEKKNKRYEEIYKAYGIDDLVRKIERLEDENEELKRLANNKQWISPCYVAENYIAKEKVDNLLKELLRKLNEPCDDRWEKDNKDYYAKIKAQINIIKQLKEG